MRRRHRSKRWAQAYGLPCPHGAAVVECALEDGQRHSEERAAHFFRSSLSTLMKGPPTSESMDAVPRRSALWRRKAASASTHRSAILRDLAVDHTAGSSGLREGWSAHRPAAVAGLEVPGRPPANARSTDEEPGRELVPGRLPVKPKTTETPLAKDRRTEHRWSPLPATERARVAIAAHLSPAERSRSLVARLLSLVAWRGHFHRPGKGQKWARHNTVVTKHDDENPAPRSQRDVGL